MIKALAVAVSGVLAGSAALAGPYVNPEFNGATVGDDYLGGALNLDVGYEGGEGAYSWFVQGGPAILMPNGSENEVEFAGKFGGSVQVAESVSVYGELSGVTGDDFSWGSKLGLKYGF
tara:strand:+ start:637 stop:990 length:354 start_codon:yes stop_codon:yes gene_type:complete